MRRASRCTDASTASSGRWSRCPRCRSRSARCAASCPTGQDALLAQVVGFHERGVLLMPLGDVEGIHPGAEVIPLRHAFDADVGDGLIGRVLDGLGRPLDGKGPLGATRRRSLGRRRPRAARARAHQRAARHRRARDRRPAHARPRPAHRHLGRLGRGQERAARHDRAPHHAPTSTSSRCSASAAARCASSSSATWARRAWRARWSSSPPATRPPSCAPPARWSPPRSPSTSATPAATCC